MPLHDKAFWFICFFLGGILLASFIVEWNERFLISFLAALFTAVIFLLSQSPRATWLSVLSLSIFLGSFYYFSYDTRQRDVVIPFGEKITLQAMVMDSSRGFEGQTLVLELQTPYKGRVRANVARYPAWEYGDRVDVLGAIKFPSEQSAKFLEKENIFGMVSFPQLTLVDKNNGSALKRVLLRIKNFSEIAFARALPPREAAFMAGLTLGETAEFSKEFREKMSDTGTTHLVALSGYNITIIAGAVMSILSFLWVSRRWQFVGSVSAILAFVVMTGAEASVVRAAIMGFIGLLANEVERAYSFRNAIAIAAFAMVLVNPKVLVWDVGFELSFLALLGLVYLRPAIVRFFNINPKPGVLKWRENLLATLAAQLAVLPLILSRFGAFSMLSLITNVLILAFVPITMTLGFSIVAVALVSGTLARFVGFIANLFVRYEMGVIDLFSRFKVLSLSFEHVGLWFSIIYYVCIISFVAWSFKKHKVRENAEIALA